MDQRTQVLSRQMETLANDLILDENAIRRFGRAWSNGFHHYSFGNLLLIWAQKHDASLCAENGKHSDHESRRR